MNITEYDQIFDYIKNPSQRHVPISVIKQAQHYEIFEERLLRNINGKFLLVIKPEEVDQIVSNAHDHPLSGHFGIEKTLQKISQYYWWPKMAKYISHYVKACSTVKK